MDISIIIPNHNGAATIGTCLQSICARADDQTEIIVVDDASTDNSVAIIQRYPCRLVQLPVHRGAAGARNAGARRSRGALLFFTDADCVFTPATMASLRRLKRRQTGGLIGGTYTPVAYDPGFFSSFQAAFIHYSETKKNPPDYIATHAMAIPAATFRASGGFPENFLPILEDVAFSHQLQKNGCPLRMAPDLLVDHIFHFNLRGSWQNAIRKANHWTLYALMKNSLLTDSGTASLELKGTSLLLALTAALFLLWQPSPWTMLLLPALLLPLNFGLFRCFFRTGGLLFGIKAMLYFCLLYPLPVAVGGLLGLGRYLFRWRNGTLVHSPMRPGRTLVPDRIVPSAKL